MTQTSHGPSLLGEAVIDLDAIAHNIHVLADRAAGARVMAVVKGDGYGHGAVQVARAAVHAGAAELGAATVDEALALRAGGVTVPILAWLHRPGTDFAPALLADVQIAISSRRQLAELLDAVHRTGRTAVTTIKVDTGMNRNGVGIADYPALLEALLAARADGAVRARGVMSHLACADEPERPETDVQARRFRDLLEFSASRGLRFEVAHLANSAAVLTRPDLAFDMVRPGVSVYGLSPLPGRGSTGLIPAMTLKTVVVFVRPLKAGDAVSYGHIWAAGTDTTVALLPLGYADGVFRNLSGQFDVLINGRRYPSVGRVCMDQFLVDLGPGPVDVVEGDEAVLFGSGAHGEPLAQDWADALHTINYEVINSPRGRVRRTYRGGGL